MFVHLTWFIVDGMQTTIDTPTTTPTSSEATAQRKQRRKIMRTIERRSFCTLATTSAAGRSHAAGVVYEAVDGALWVHVMRSSRKARNVANNPDVGVGIAFRRLPFGPPYTIHFQAKARLVEMDDPAVGGLLEAGKLKSISGHGALDEPDGCFLEIRPNGTLHSFGLGVPVIDLVRDPLNTGGRHVELDEQVLSA